MRRYSCFMVVVLGIFSSYGQKHFSKGDYTFYDKDFMLPVSSVLRTDGVYVLNRIWTDANGGTEKRPHEHKLYKFYKSGQCNMLLDTDTKLKTVQDYTDAINSNAGKEQRPTLFESYYKLKGDRIIIQGIVYPIKQFEYKYGYIAEGVLIIVKATREGKGAFKDAYFTDYYKEYYSFVPLDLIEPDGYPDW